MSQLLASSAVLVAFLGGVVALLAPCCVSVMLPAYLASGLRSRTRIVTMTGVFAAGVATVILPLALGASALSRLLLGYHTPVFAVGGALMVVGGLAMALGASFKLPMPGSAPRPGTGLRSVYVLGAFSGAASACCAPVLVGVVALASVAGSFGVATVIGVTYVFGMVAPLAAFALVWDRRNWGQSRFFRANSIKVRIGGLSRPTSLANLLSGGLLVLMGVLTAVLAFRGPGMSSDGWQLRVTADLQHWVSVLRSNLEWLPGWVSALLVLALLAAFIRAASRPRRVPASAPGRLAPVPDAPGSCSRAKHGHPVRRHREGTPMTDLASTSAAQASRRDRRTRSRVTPAPAAPPPVWRRGTTWMWSAVAFFAVGVLFVSFQSAGQASTAAAAGEGYVVGSPGPGKTAPDVRLASTGGQVDLAGLKGKSVLLYFQEGIGCQPCWDQIRDLEKDEARLKAAGVDELISVTTGPLDLLERKATDDGLRTPIASDPDLRVSKAYDANKYGMMGTMANGHSFVLVGPDGKITWRADYGGAPKYTMYVPVDKLLADLAKGKADAA